MALPVAAAAPTADVAGSIKPERTSIDRALELWMAQMQVRDCSAASVKRYQWLIKRARLFCGWRDVADLTNASATEFIAAGADGKLGPKPWGVETRNQAVAIFRSFARFLQESGFRDDNPMLALRKSAKGGGEGSRAATVEEARALIARAVQRTQSGDKRTPREAPYYYLTLFLSGLRVGEAARMRWTDIADLDGPTPQIVTDPKWDKSGKRHRVPINPELRERLLEWRKIRGGEGVVFPQPPTRQTFILDRTDAGIKAKDSRARWFTMHGARKTLRTQLVLLGVPEAVTMRIIRHAMGITGRYCDFSAITEADAVARLARLWPENNGKSCSSPLANPADEDYRSGSPAKTDQPHNVETTRFPARSSLRDDKGREARFGPGDEPGQQNPESNALTPISPFDPAVLGAASDLLEAASRLVRLVSRRETGNGPVRQDGAA